MIKYGAGKRKQEDLKTRLKDTGLSAQDIKDKVNKYMIETYERFDFLAETAKDMYLYDENAMAADAMKSGNIAVNPRASRQCDIEMLYKKAL